MLSKKDCLSRLNSFGYTYEFIFDNIDDKTLGEVVPILIEEKVFTSKDSKSIIYDFVNSIAAISKNNNNQIVVIAGLKKTFNSNINNFVYNLWYYRTKVNPFPLMGHDLVTNLTYWCSFEYLKKNNINDIKALQTEFSNTRIDQVLTALKKRKTKVFLTQLEHLGKDSKNNDLYGKYY